MRRLLRAPGGVLALVAAAALAFVGGAEALGSAIDPEPAPATPPPPPPVDAAPPSDPTPVADDTFYPEVPAVDLESRVSRFWWERTADARPLTPARWRRRMPPHCQTRGGYKQHCAGELIMPEPHGRAAEFAQHLGLGHSASAMQILYGPPFPEWLDAVAHLDEDPTLTFPVPEGRLGRGFGLTRRGALRNRGHKGVDIGAEEGSDIVAARDGLVVYAGKQITGYGNLVVLLHRNGHSTAYAHCRAIAVFAGQYVDRGEKIAEVGTTGFAYRPHLHFEWRQRGWIRDPAKKLRHKEHPVAAAPPTSSDDTGDDDARGLDEEPPNDDEGGPIEAPGES